MSSVSENQETNISIRRSNRLIKQGVRMPSAALLAAKKAAAERAKKAQNTLMKDPYKLAQDAKDMVKKETGVVYDMQMAEHRCLWDENYPECPDRFLRVLERCKEMGLISRCKLIKAREATDVEILKKHTLEQIKILKETENSQNFDALEDVSSHYDAIYIHPCTYRLSLLAVGSTIDLVDSICKNEIQNGMAIIRPPGHHAMKSEYCGYCFFNNVALAAQHALDNLGISKILIVDWDVHHGQATQQMFYNDNRVVYFSIHRYEHGKFWPNLRESDFDYIGEGVGKGYNFNVPLNKIGMTDSDYIAIFHQVLLPMAYEFQPELIIVSSGYDAAIGCFEGEMKITPACYAHLVNSLSGLGSGKIAVVLEGGYYLKSLAEGAALTLRALLGDPCPMLNSLVKPCDSIIDTILNVIYTHQDFWQCFQFTEKYSLNDKNDVSKVKKHYPAAPFNFTGEAKCEKYLTRNCYPVHAPGTTEKLDKWLDDLIYRTKLLAPKPVCFVYDEIMLRHKNIQDLDHPEKPARLSTIFDRHEEYNLLKRLHILKSREASKEELLLVHSPSHVEAMEQLSTLSEAELKSKADEFNSIYFNEHSFEAATLAAGSLLQVVDSVLNDESRSGVAVVRPPGHHAEVDEPCGFCLFNSASIAAKYAVEMHGLKRVLLLDWDVHHGNGSQEIFEEDPNVLYLSLHRYDHGTFFPNSKDADYDVVGSGRGKGFNVNIPWNKRGMGNAEYIAAFHQVILPIAYQFNPELVIISAGFDAAVGDPLGGCKVTPEAYGHFTHWLSSLANGRVILTLEGGYNVQTISYSMTMCTKALLHDPLPSLDPLLPINPSAVQSIKQVISTQSEFWSALQFLVALPQENVLENTVCELSSLTEKLSLNESYCKIDMKKSKLGDKDHGDFDSINSCSINSLDSSECKVNNKGFNSSLSSSSPLSYGSISETSTPNQMKNDDSTFGSLNSSSNFLSCDSSFQTNASPSNFEIFLNMDQPGSSNQSLPGSSSGEVASSSSQSASDQPEKTQTLSDYLSENMEIKTLGQEAFSPPVPSHSPNAENSSKTSSQETSSS